MSPLFSLCRRQSSFFILLSPLAATDSREALAAGLPVVAVAKEGVADVLKNGVGCLLIDDDIQLHPWYGHRFDCRVVEFQHVE